MSAAVEVVQSDARESWNVRDSVDLIVTSPPYWRKRRYGVPGEIGWEPSPEAYAESIGQCLDAWEHALRPTGSVALNVGDTWHRKSLAGVPYEVERVARDRGWVVRHRIAWTKTRGMPEPAAGRLASRHEVVLHLVRSDDFYHDVWGYKQALGVKGTPGDVWEIDPDRNLHSHPAPFPRELVRRCILLWCPERVCDTCLAPHRRVLERGSGLDETRPQAKRAMELATAARLTPAHLAAIRSVGISDAGKAAKIQTGTGRNTAEVQRLAGEAKAALGGYFREFTMAPLVHVGWSDCGHDDWQPGVVFDPFVGSGTTVDVAASMGREALGSDAAPSGEVPSNGDAAGGAG